MSASGQPVAQGQQPFVFDPVKAEDAYKKAEQAAEALAQTGKQFSARRDAFTLAFVEFWNTVVPTDELNRLRSDLNASATARDDATIQLRSDLAVFLKGKFPDLKLDWRSPNPVKPLFQHMWLNAKIAKNWDKDDAIKQLDFIKHQETIGQVESRESGEGMLISRYATKALAIIDMSSTDPNAEKTVMGWSFRELADEYKDWQEKHPSIAVRKVGAPRGPRTNGGTTATQGTTASVAAEDLKKRTDKEAAEQQRQHEDRLRSMLTSRAFGPKGTPKFHVVKLNPETIEGEATETKPEEAKAEAPVDDPKVEAKVEANESETEEAPASEAKEADTVVEEAPASEAKEADTVVEEAVEESKVERWHPLWSEDDNLITFAVLADYLSEMPDKGKLTYEKIDGKITITGWIG